MEEYEYDVIVSREMKDFISDIARSVYELVRLQTKATEFSLVLYQISLDKVYESICCFQDVACLYL
jgi:hypothetical protein